MKKTTLRNLSKALLLPVLGLTTMLPGRTAAQTPSWQWALTHQANGATNQSFGYDAVTDGAGNTVLAGNFSGTITLGSFTLTSAGSQDVFVARISPSGTWLQAVRGGGGGYDHANALALDPAGNAIVGGFFLAATTTFGATSIANVNAGAGTGDLFVATLSPAGAWTRALGAGGAGMDVLQDLACDAGGTTTVVGNFGAAPGSTAAASIAFGSVTLTGGNQSADELFVARLSPTGIWTQAVSAGGPGVDHAVAVAVDAAGNATLAGNYSSPTLRFGTLTLNNTTSIDYSDVFVARFSAAGQWMQAVGAGGADSDQATVLALDAAGNATVVGSFSSPTMAFGSTSLPNSGSGPDLGSDVFVARLGAAGVWEMSSRAGGDASEQALGLALDASGNATVVGYFSSSSMLIGTVTLLNANPTASNPGSDLFVARISPGGAWDRVSGAGGSGSEQATAVLLDAAGYPTIAGTINSPVVRFGSLTVGSGGPSVVIARMGALASAARPALLAGNLRLSPNPAWGTVQVGLPVARAAVLSVFDALGREVLRQALPIHLQKAILDVQALPAGLYTVRCGTATGRLIIE